MSSYNFEVDSYYHVYNRGVDKRKIFLDSADYARFIHYLYICNDEASLEKSDQRKIVYESFLEKEKTSRKKLVDIICFALMPNHFHLCLYEHTEKGISRFMQKVMTGYTMYFNAKQERTGVLFQGRFKAIEVGDERYLAELIRYIHLNPVDLIQPDWKEDGINDPKKIQDYLESYGWSSFLDYIGKRNFPSVISLDKKHKELGFREPAEYKEFVFNEINSYNPGGLIDGFAIEE
jgi:putative transposase